MNEPTNIAQYHKGQPQETQPDLQAGPDSDQPFYITPRMAEKRDDAHVRSFCGTRIDPTARDAFNDTNDKSAC